MKIFNQDVAQIRNHSQKQPQVYQLAPLNMFSSLLNFQFEIYYIIFHVFVFMRFKLQLSWRCDIRCGAWRGCLSVDLNNRLLPSLPTAIELDILISNASYIPKYFERCKIKRIKLNLYHHLNRIIKANWFSNSIALIKLRWKTPGYIEKYM